ncbi:potassium channel family protein [Luteibacter sp. HA06]
MALAIVAIVGSYVGLAGAVAKRLEYQQRHLPSAILLFIVIAALVILDFAVLGYRPWDLVIPNDPWRGPALEGPSRLGPIDQLYFSTMTFTSVGFGDLVPRAPAGQWLAMIEALMGMGHGVFFVLVFLRGGVPTGTGGTAQCVARTPDAAPREGVQRDQLNTESSSNATA